MIRRVSDGYCHHFGRMTHHCVIYENRPITCRAYDCRSDKRIWEDFGNMVVSQELENLFKQPDKNNGEESSRNLEQSAL
jgi:Fe-S-cluster containining protein